jgi:signal transduction histidine kinase
MSGLRRRRRGAPLTLRGRSPVFAAARPHLWEHRNVSRPLGLAPRATAVGVLMSAALAALLAGAVANDLASAGADVLTVTGDLLVGVVWIGVAVASWPQERTRRAAAIAAGFAAAWLAGSIEPALVVLHRGPLMHLVLAYPTGRLDSGVARLVVGAAYVQGALGAELDGPGWTLAFAAVLVAAASTRALAATGAVRRSRLVPLAVSASAGTVLAIGAASRLADGEADVLVAYELVLFVAGCTVAADLRLARWSQATIAGLVVDLGERAVGGVVRERIARAIGDPTLDVAYVLDDSRPPVDEHGRVVELPTDSDPRVVTPVDLAGQRLALLIHDPAVLADRSVIDAATGAVSVAVANAQLQTTVRASVAEVEASTRRLLDAADAERRRLGSELRADVEPLLREAADELRAADAEETLIARVDAVRGQLFRLAGGLDPVMLDERGLGAALRELADHAGMPVSVSAPDERFPSEVEKCVWFTCSEAVANALKHAHASRLEIVVRAARGALDVAVSDNGVGGADPANGSGLRRLAGRVESAGGSLAVYSPPGAGTRVVAKLRPEAVA